MTRDELAGIVLEYEDFLYNYALRLTQFRTHDSRDLVQETFALALANADKFDGANPQAWLATILRNAYINTYRRSRRSIVLDEAELEAEADIRDSAPSAEWEVVSQTFSPEVANAWELLLDQFKSVVWLVDVEGFSYDETANQLGIKVGTVMSRLSRGRKILREALV